MKIINSVIVVLICFNTSTAQINSLDDVYTPKGSVFSETKNSSSSSNSSLNDYPRHLIKFPVALMPRGIAALHYELKVHENITLQAGAGFNFNKDRAFQLLGSELELSSSRESGQVSINDIYTSSEHESNAPYFFIGPKFIRESDWWEGYSYIELGYRHYNNKLKYTFPNSYGNTAKFVGSNLIEMSQNQFLLTFGTQYFTSGKIATSHEFYFGLGMRNINYNPISYTESYDINSTNYGTIYKASAEKKTVTNFLITCGYNLGIGFGK